MPVIEVHLLEGYTPADHQRLSEALTDAMRLVVPAPAEAITVMFHEMPATHYYRGRTTRVPAAALEDPAQIVHQFLSCLGTRDIDGANKYLAANAQLQFPNSSLMTSLDELIEWSIPRYRRIEKSFEHTEAFGSAEGTSVVYCRGTLAGEFPDGSQFEGIRFIDRFELSNGLIVSQDVWNDLAEFRQAQFQQTSSAQS